MADDPKKPTTQPPEVDAVLDDYADEELSGDEAADDLEDLGLDEDEIDELIADEDEVDESVNGLTLETILAIAAVVRWGLREDKSPDEIAQMVEDSVGLATPGALAVLNYREGLEEIGTAEANIDSLVDRYSDRLLNARAETLSRTETMKHLNDAVREEWAQRLEDGELKDGLVQEWIITPDDLLCPICEEMEGETTPVGENFSIDGPPAHPNCRCTVGLVEA